jgi:uncharacterized protein YecT (DUF1311 family)
VRLSAIFVLCLLSCPPAFARFGISPLDVVVGGSVAVVDATIVSARPMDYRYSNHSATCGYVYEARVVQGFKGELHDTFVFASNLSMAPQTRQLVFLRSYQGDFPSDQSISIEDPSDPGYDAGVRQARAACLARLPQLKANYLHAGEFVPGAEPGGQLISVSHWIGLPTEVADDYGTGPRLVEWSLLRAWLLRHAADVLDTSGLEAGCDAACIRLAFEQTEVTMQRNFEGGRRDITQLPGAAAAFDAAQGAWRAYVAASCEPPIPASGSPERDLSVATCRLRFTQARARELWLIRNAPASALGVISDPCNEACMAGMGREAVDEIDHRLAQSRRRLAGNAAALAAIDAGQEAWNAYREANCRAVALGVRDATAAGSLTAWCRLRQAEARINELYGLYLSTADEPVAAGRDQRD